MRTEKIEGLLFIMLHTASVEGAGFQVLSIGSSLPAVYLKR